MTEKNIEDWAAELKDWPATQSRYFCASAHPMPKGAPFQWIHEGAHTVDGRVDQWECSDCGHRWEQEVPE